MRATTQRMALLETLGKVKSAVSGKHLLPVCTSVLIRAGGGEVTLVGTDLDVTDSKLQGYCYTSRSSNRTASSAGSLPEGNESRHSRSISGEQEIPEDRG
jgi:hypothetical protein